MALIKKINVNGEVYDIGGSSDAVQYTVQTLTDSQKAQARANIDAAIIYTETPPNDAEVGAIWIDFNAE